MKTSLTASMIADRMMPVAHYEIDLRWQNLEAHLDYELRAGLDLDPDFQRGHVWTPSQRVAWVEHVLTRGDVGKTLLVAHVGTRSHESDRNGQIQGYCLVDGKQRLTTVRAFLRGDFGVFADPEHPEGYLWSELGPDLKRDFTVRFHWRVVVVPTRAEILRLYLKINAQGTPHTAAEIARVQRLLAEETAT